MARTPKVDGEERADSILEPVGTTGVLEQRGDMVPLHLKKIPELLCAEHMGGSCCFGPDWQGW